MVAKSIQDHRHCAGGVTLQLGRAEVKRALMSRLARTEKPIVLARVRLPTWKATSRTGVTKRYTVFRTSRASSRRVMSRVHRAPPPQMLECIKGKGNMRIRLLTSILLLALAT